MAHGDSSLVFWGRMPRIKYCLATLKPETMILSCPECSARFLIASHLIGEDGRQVKCGVCGHVWHQGPEEGDVSEIQTDDPVDDEPVEDYDEPPREAVHIESDIEVALVEHEETGASGSGEADSGMMRSAARRRSPPPEPEDHPQAQIFGYAAAGALCVLLFAGLIPLKDAMVSVWPPSAQLYMLLGMEVDVPGSGVVFDRVMANGEGGAHPRISLDGALINLRGEPSSVPDIRVLFLDEFGHDVGTQVIARPVRMLEGEGAVQIHAVLEDVPEQTATASLSFALGKVKAGTKAGAAKTVPEDAEDTHVPDQDDHAPMHGGEFHPQSHQSDAHDAPAGGSHSGHH